MDKNKILLKFGNKQNDNKQNNIFPSKTVMNTNANIKHDLIYQSVINPIKIEKNGNDKQKLEKEYIEIKKKFDNSVNISNNSKKGTIVSISSKEKPKELTIHETTAEDKKQTIQKYKTYINDRKKEEKDINTIYSKEKQNEHLKNFKYNHIEKHKIKYNPTSHEDLKSDIDKNNKVNLEKERVKNETMDMLKKNGLLDMDTSNNAITQNIQDMMNKYASGNKK